MPRQARRGASAYPAIIRIYNALDSVGACRGTPPARPLPLDMAQKNHDKPA